MHSDLLYTLSRDITSCWVDADCGADSPITHVQAFCTPTGRTIDVATVLCQESGLLAVVSPGQQVALAERLDKHIFPMDKVEVSDITPETKYAAKSSLLCTQRAALEHF